LGRASLAATAAAIVAALTPLASGAPSARLADGCTLWASDRGNDGNIGTAPLPFRTVTKLMASLRAGQTGCLVPGSVFLERVTIRFGGPPSAPIRLRTAPGRRAVIRGGLTVQDGADNLVLSSLVIEGRGTGRAVVGIGGNGVALIRSDVSGPGHLNRSVACVILDGTIGTLLDGNTIHNCTRISRRRGLYSPGIWAANAQLTTIVNNFVYHVAGDGIALSPNAQNSKVSRNLVDGNVSGIFIGGDHRTASSSNLVVDNIVSYSGRFNVHSSFQPRGPFGRNNLISRNCLWKGFAGNLAGSRGYVAVRNLVVNPRYLNRPRSLALRPGTRCFGKRPASFRSTTTNLSSPYPVLGAFLVAYRLRALPSRVQVLRLSMEKLLPGASVEVRCVRGCRAVENLRAGATGLASSRRLRGRWLGRGSVVDVRARVPNWVGAFARVTVTGAPRGVRIRHACLAPTGETAPVPCARYTRG
jgi:hypothetical protein